MSAPSGKMRRVEDRYIHWCPGCEELHPLPDRWVFDGNLERPTFTPSFRHSWVLFDAYTDEGEGVGEPRRHACHYFVIAGQLAFCADSTHALAGTTVPMPDLPEDV